MRFFLPFLLLVASSGCRHHFPLPYTTTQLMKDSSSWPGDALVHYLTQPNADVSVCAMTPPLHRTDEALVGPFVTALEEQSLSPERWQRCATRLVPALAPAEQELTWSRLARVILALLEVEQSGPRLIAAHEVVASRPQAPSPALESLAHQLLEFPREKLAPALAPVFDTLVATLELDHGQLAGRKLTDVDVNATQDEGLLGRMALRLPDAALRGLARRRLIRLRIERSETKEVKARAAEVEAAVMETGRWAQPVSSLRLERPELPLALPFEALVRQHVEAQVVTLLSPGPGAEQLTPLLDLKGSLHFPVGWSRPLSLCAAPSVLSVEPCIEAREVEVANELVRLDAEGLLRLPERLTMPQAMELARVGEGLVLPIRLAGQLVTSLQVPLRFEAPRSIQFQGGEGERGPAVNVVVQAVPSALLITAVSETGAQRMVIVPRGIASYFEVASLGGPGERGRTGRDGQDGARGYDGSNASCPSTPGQSGGRGGDGHRGEQGWQGGDGGDGGPVSVVLQCGGSCPEDEQWVRSMIQSRGGEGGDGGKGGQGGDGGNGGNGGFGTSCSGQSLPAGDSGATGNDGSQGASGQDGAQGQPGPVQFQLQ